MSAPSPSSFNGSFTQASLAELLQNIASRRVSGELRLQTGEQRARLHFIQGKLAAAEASDSGAETAFGQVAAWSGGRFEFVEGFVQLSQLAARNRIHQTLDSLLAKVSPVTKQTPAAPVTSPISPQAVNSNAAIPGITRSPGTSPITSNTQPSKPVERPAPSPQPLELDVFDLDALDDLDAAPMRPGFLEALTALFVRTIGPAGYVLLEDVAQDLRVDSRTMTPVQATRLIARLLTQLPGPQRGAFQHACTGYLDQFKP
jgi:Domain of unknown function (DUF4388)